MRPISPALAARDRRRVHAHGRAADRRRSAERIAAAPGTFLVQPRDRPARRISSRSARRSARGVPIGAAMLSRTVATAIVARRPRHDLRRQPARVPRGARRSSTRSTAACRIARARRVGAPVRGSARARRAAPDGRRDVRGAGLIAGLELDDRRAAGRRRRARARPARQSHVDDRRAAAAAVHRHASATSTRRWRFWTTS